MAKKKTVTVTEVSRFEIPGGATIIKFSDGSIQFFSAPLHLTSADVEAILSDGSANEADDDDDEDGVSIEDMKAALNESGVTKKAALNESGVTKKALKKMSDEEIEEAYANLSDEEEEDDEEEEEEEDDEEGEEEEDGDDEEDEDEEDEEDDEELTPEALSEMDFEELEDLCDDKDLETSPDDFEEDDVEKLRKAVAKELGITLKSKKKKK
jgi:uncharacterized metal-binding protein